MLLAARWLEDARCPVDRVALALGFDAGTGLRHMLARYTGLRAAEVRARGGLAAVLPLFVAAVEAGAREGKGGDVGSASVTWNHCATRELQVLSCHLPCC